MNVLEASLQKPGTPINRITFFVGAIGIHIINLFFTKASGISGMAIVFVGILLDIAYLILAYNRLLDIKEPKTAKKLMFLIAPSVILLSFVPEKEQFTIPIAIVFMFVTVIWAVSIFYLIFKPGKLSQEKVSKTDNVDKVD